MFQIIRRLICALRGQHRWLSMLYVSETQWEGRRCYSCGHKGLRKEGDKIIPVR